MNQKTLKGVTYIMINTIIWGLAPVIIKISTVNITIDRFLFLRFLLVVPLFIIYLMFKKIKKNCMFKNLKFWIANPDLLISAVLANAIVLLFLFKGIEKTDAVVGSLAGATVPIISMIIGKNLFKETINKRELVGGIISLIGFILYVVFSNTKGQNISITGILLVFLGNILWIISNVLLKKYTLDKKTTPKEFTCLNFAYLNISFIIALIFFTLNLALRNDLDWLFTSQLKENLITPGVLYMAIASTVIAYVFFNKSLKYLELSEVNYFVFIQPIFAIIGSLLLIHNYQIDFANLTILSIILIGFLFNLKGIGK